MKLSKNDRPSDLVVVRCMKNAYIAVSQGGATKARVGNECYSCPWEETDEMYKRSKGLKIRNVNTK